MGGTIHTYISCLNGLPTSELTNISALYTSIPASIDFIVSQHIEQEQEANELAYTDAILSYENLSSFVSDCIPRTEMMQLDKHQFAQSSHSHPKYDWLKVWPDFGKNGKHKDIEVSAVLATVHFKNAGVQNDVDICLPVIEYDNTARRPKHLIGELMFVAAKSYDDIVKQVGNISDLNDENFSGWIYPNGQTLYTKRFEYMDAKELFGMPATAASFTVPDIAGYFKPTCDESYEAVLEKQSGVNGVPSHTHASVVMAESSNTKTQLYSKEIRIPNGRAKSNGIPLTSEEVETINKENRKGIVCAWPSLQEYENALPAAHPAGFRYINNELDKDIFTIEFDDISFANASRNLSFKVTKLKMHDTGTAYDADNEQETMSWPDSTFVPVLMYIGFPNNDKYKYWG